MSEDVMLRFSLAARLNRMRYGDSQIIDQDKAHKAWPPTGDHDRSFEGAFHAMALAAGGHRPETSYTTEERIRRDLDETFDVEQRSMDGSWIIHRRVRECPHCKGSGFVRSYRPYESMAVFDPSASLSMDSMVVDVKTKPCAHEPD